MTASVAHDFNNLLSVIVVCADEIAADGTGVQRERAREIREAADRGAELSRRLLDRGGPAAIEPEPLAVDLALSDSLPLIRRTLDPATELTLTSQGRLPSVRLASGDLQRMLVNLAANSRDAMVSRGAVAIRSAAVAVQPGDSHLPTGWCVRIGFSDSGSGMTPEVARRAVNPYFTTKRGTAEGGSGFGLATVLALARSRGGDLRIDTTPGAGTTVAIYLPAVRANGEPLTIGPPRLAA